MPTLQEITDAIDARIDQLWPTAEAKQAAYRAKRGRYFQGQWTHGTLPADGAARDPDRLKSKPHDQAESWQDEGWPVPSPRVAMRCDAYTGGFAITFRLRIGGTVYERTRDSGPEPWRNVPWHAVPAGEVA